MKAFDINFTGSIGWNNSRIMQRDRAWLAFLPKGEEERIKNGNPFIGVKLLDTADPEIHAKLTAKLVSRGHESVNLDDYDVYSVYKTTCG